MTNEESEQKARLVGRLVEATLGLTDLAGIYLGDRLGYYRVLRERGPLNASDLAHAARTDLRYTREWLEQQAVTGLLRVAAASDDGDLRTYELPSAHAVVLVDRDDPDYFAPVARFFVSVVARTPDLLRAYESGRGVAYAAYGDDAREAGAEINRGWFLRDLAGWIPAAAPEVHERLAASGGRIADVGCGLGHSTIALARAYPKARVEGFDPDAPSIAKARALAVEAGVTDRTVFCEEGASGLRGDVDLITFFEVLHDLADPVGALRAARGALAPGGALVIADERVAERFVAPADENERLMYALSMLFCLPTGRDAAESAATGAVMRPDTLRGYARAAGFEGEVEVLAIAHPIWRFYRIH